MPEGGTKGTTFKLELNGLPPPGGITEWVMFTLGLTAVSVTCCKDTEQVTF